MPGEDSHLSDHAPSRAYKRPTSASAGRTLRRAPNAAGLQAPAALSLARSVLPHAVRPAEAELGRFMRSESYGG